MSQRCLVHQILAGERCPAEIAIETLHASCVRMQTEFARRPSAELAVTITRMLGVLARHPDRFGAAAGLQVYAQAAAVWQEIATELRCVGAIVPSATMAVH